MQRLVDDLLLLAESDAREPVQHRDSVDLDDIVLGEAARLRAGGAMIDTGGVSAGQVRGDAEQLLRAVRNVMENAARNATNVVRVSLGEAGGEVVLAVDDDGPGVPKDGRERIFERFTRLDAARTSGSGGAGLGLAIARTIAEGHGGTLAVERSKGPGARFVFRFPEGN